MFGVFSSPKKEDIKFGPPHAALNLSKIGLRYFRIAIKASEASKKRLAQRFINHPNVGWIFYAEGWFNLAVGIWAKDNAEINDVSQQVRSVLSPDDEIVFQSELTSLYSFGNRAVTGTGEPMCLVDATVHPVQLSPLEIDYIKLLALDSSLAPAELSRILNIGEAEIEGLHKKLTTSGVIVGNQERIDYAGMYFKVFVDSLSRKTEAAESNLVKMLWDDPACIYFERANSKYDIEFELILQSKSDIKKYLQEFSEYKTVLLTQNVYTNLYPVNKVANLKSIKDALVSQEGVIRDLRNSKLWYLNYAGAKAYLDIYSGNQQYFETMEKSELDLFPQVATFLKQKYSGKRFDVIDIGSGDGMKGRAFIQKLEEELVKAYYPVDIQSIELAAALSAHEEGRYAKHPTLLDIENLSSRFPLKSAPEEQQLYIFLGGTYGNFKPEQINGHLKPLLRDGVALVVSMPLVGKRTEKEIISSYVGEQFENTIFGPLAQVGFRRADFEQNVDYPSTIAQFHMEDDRLVSSLVLKRSVRIFDKTFEKGTRFLITTSWKPTLDQFRTALETDFQVEKIFHGENMAMAIITAAR